MSQGSTPPASAPQVRFPIVAQPCSGLRPCIMPPVLPGHNFPFQLPGQPHRFYPAGPNQKLASNAPILVHGQIIRFDAPGAMDQRMAQPHPGTLGPIFIPPKSFTRESFLQRFPGLPPPPPGYAACFFQPPPGAVFTPCPRLATHIRSIQAVPSQNPTKEGPCPVAASPSCKLSHPTTPPSTTSSTLTPSTSTPSTSTSSSTPLPQSQNKDGIQMLIDCLIPLTETTSSSDDSICSADSGNATANSSLEVSPQKTTSPEESIHTATSALLALPTVSIQTATTPQPPKARRGRKRRAQPSDDSAVTPKSGKRGRRVSAVKWPETRKEDAHYKVLGLKCLVTSCKIIVANDEQLAHHLNDCHDETGLFQCAITGCGLSFKTSESFNSHIAIHSALMPSFSCQSCSQDFGSYAKLDTHYRNTHEGGLFECAFCSHCRVVFNKRGDVLQHLVSRHHLNQP